MLLENVEKRSVPNAIPFQKPNRNQSIDQNPIHWFLSVPETMFGSHGSWNEHYPNGHLLKDWLPPQFNPSLNNRCPGCCLESGRARRGLPGDRQHRN